MKDFTKYKPETIDEAVDIFYNCLEKDDIDVIMGQDPDEFAGNHHQFGLGLAIRNAWIYGTGKLRVPADYEFYWICSDPDDISDMILKRVFRRVKGLPEITEEEKELANPHYEEKPTMISVLDDIKLLAPWQEIARHYFEEPVKWFHDRLNGTEREDGYKMSFTPFEKRVLRDALLDIAKRIQAAAEKIDCS